MNRNALFLALYGENFHLKDSGRQNNFYTWLFYYFLFKRGLAIDPDSR